MRKETRSFAPDIFGAVGTASMASSSTSRTRPLLAAILFMLSPRAGLFVVA